MGAYKEMVGGDTQHLVSRVYLCDLQTAWQAVLESLKSYRFDVMNREAGFIQTSWQENTSERNFTDSFGKAEAYLETKFRFRISVAKGFFEGKPSVKVSIVKEQIVKRDALEGWTGVETESIEEFTLLYRIGRLIVMTTKIKELEDQRRNKELEKAQF